MRVNAWLDRRYGADAWAGLVYRIGKVGMHMDLAWSRHWRSQTATLCWPSYKRDETFVGRIKCCCSMSKFEYTLRFNRQTDGRQTDMFNAYCYGRCQRWGAVL